MATAVCDACESIDAVVCSTMSSGMLPANTVLLLSPHTTVGVVDIVVVYVCGCKSGGVREWFAALRVMVCSSAVATSRRLCDRGWCARVCVYGVCVAW